MKIPCVTYAFWIMALLWSPLHPHPTWAQSLDAVRSTAPASASLIKLSLEQISSFDQAMLALAQQSHMTFIVEGQPLRTQIPPEALLKISTDGGKLSDLAPKIASAYDYDAQLSGQTYLLRKRYTDSHDLPDVTLAECAAALQDVGQVLDRFNPHFAEGSIASSAAMQDFFGSLTPEQTLAMADKKRGLPVALLTPNQQQDIQQFVLYFYAEESANKTQAALAAVNKASQNDVQFCWRDINDLYHSSKIRFSGDTRLFGFLSPGSVPGQTVFSPLSKPTAIEGQGNALAVHSFTLTNGVADLPSLPDPTDPIPQSRTPKTAEGKLGSSLSQILDRFNVRAKGRPQMVVDAALAPKRAVIYGEEFTPPNQLLYALAELYGLRVVTDEKARLCLTRPAVQLPSEFSGIYQAMQRVLPDPLLRAQRQQEVRRPSPLRVASVQYLRTVIEPKFKTAKGGLVPLSVLSSKENMALATALASDAVAALNQSLQRPTPPMVMYFDQIRLTGSVTDEEGHKVASLFLNLPNADGTGLIPGPGVGNMNYDP